MFQSLLTVGTSSAMIDLFGVTNIMGYALALYQERLGITEYPSGNARSSSSIILS